MCVFPAPPSAELVKRVRELYHRNSSDVRFLIPVLHGLQKVSTSPLYELSAASGRELVLKHVQLYVSISSHLLL